MKVDHHILFYITNPHAVIWYPIKLPQIIPVRCNFVYIIMSYLINMYIIQSKTKNKMPHSYNIQSKILSGRGKIDTSNTHIHYRSFPSMAWYRHVRKKWWDNLFIGHKT